MKAHPCFLLLACLSLHARAADTVKLEVHEWGTMTVLSGSDGVPLRWYQGPGFADELPSFVRINPIGAKSAFNPTGSVLRMETPVIYFYPEKAMRVSVGVTLQGGQITEWFPDMKPSEDMWVKPLNWEGDLLAPTDVTARTQMPEVLPGKGEHYRYAREVPAAWIFRGTTPAAREDKDPAKGKDADKFIFYRGKSECGPPFQVRVASDGTLTMRHCGPGDGIAAAFALTVREGLAYWSPIPALGVAKVDDPAALDSQTAAHPNPVGVPVDKAATELTGAMHEALVRAGLTPDEAHAMVMTWNGNWFREPGTRVLAILPQTWIDQVLPLTISPSPTKLTRVFVARFEVLTHERESALLTLLNDTAEVRRDGPQATGFDKLQFGRFAQGALLRAQNMQNQRMNEKFWKLQQAVSQMPLKGAQTSAAR